ncbi:MAG: hypothetical protein GY906_23430 [bacterium]|nr:hypothetical protein [bacterium]
MSSKLNNKIEAYYAARADYDEKKQISDAADKMRRHREAELVDCMMEEKIKKVSRDDGTTPALANIVSIGIKKEDFDSIRIWLNDTIGDESDFVEEVVSKPALLEHVKKLILEEKFDPSELPAFLHCDTRPTLRVTGWKTRGG